MGILGSSPFTLVPKGASRVMVALDPRQRTKSFVSKRQSRMKQNMKMTADFNCANKTSTPPYPAACISLKKFGFLRETVFERLIIKIKKIICAVTNLCLIRNEESNEDGHNTTVSFLYVLLLL
jgi:hypothetical protein